MMAWLRHCGCALRWTQTLFAVYIILRSLMYVCSCKPPATVLSSAVGHGSRWPDHGISLKTLIDWKQNNTYLVLWYQLHWGNISMSGQ